MSYSTASLSTFYHRYHVGWATKYRYKVLQGSMRERIREIIRQTCAAALPVITRQGVSTMALEDRVPAPDRVIVQVKELCDFGAALTVIQKQYRVRSPDNAMIFALAAHTSLKGATVCWGKKTGTYHAPTSVA